MKQEYATQIGGARGSRWVLLAVLSSITVINYIDRQAISILYPLMARSLHLPEQTYTSLVTLFLVAYTVMYAVGGWLVDKIGARNGLALALSWWSAATVLTALAHTAFWLEVFRVMLALGQPMVFSAGVKACAEFFPPGQRALATGIFSAGSGIGALLATPILAAVALHAGWRLAMTTPGIMGIFLVPIWIAAYNKTQPIPVRPEELGISRSWRTVFRDRRAWALILPRALGDPLWYFCFFWIPVYLQQARHLDLRAMVMMGWLPFLFADLGSVLGGSLSDALVRRGHSPVRARLKVLWASGFVALFGALIGWVPSVWTAVLLMGALAFVSQCWTITTTALAMDIFPRSSIGGIAGLMGTAGGIGAAIFSQFAGTTIDHFGFTPVFVVAALLIPVAVTMLVVLLRADKSFASALLNDNVTRV